MAQFEDEEVERQITQLETQELSAPAGVQTPEIYSQLLGLYLLKNDLINAKFLWKRTPLAVQKGQPELEKLWRLGQFLWNRDLPALYTFAGQAVWSETSKPLVAALLEKTRQRQFDLVGLAYACIQADQLAAMVGLGTPEVVANVTSHGWEYDAAEGMLYPNQTASAGGHNGEAMGGDISSSGVEEDSVMNAELISKVTHFMSFIENH